MNMNVEKGLIDEQSLSAAASGVQQELKDEKEKPTNIFQKLILNLKNRLQRLKKQSNTLTLKKQKSEEMLEYEKIAGTIGVLLFGREYCGKNTLLLHLQQLFGEPVSVDNFFTPIIHQIIVDGCKNIIEFAEEKGFDLSEYKTEIFDINACKSDDPILPEHVLSFKRFWSSPFAQQAFDERKEKIFQYTPLEPLEHYIPKLNQICKNDYIPTFQDAIRIPIKYTKQGIKDLNINIENIPFKFTALLNNSTSNIKKIGLQFDETQLPIPISCILFMMELPYTDPKSARASSKLPISELLQEDLDLFDKIISLNCFQNKQSCLILLSKADLFFYQGLRHDTHENVLNEIMEEFQQRWVENKMKYKERKKKERDEEGGGDDDHIEDDANNVFIDFKVCCNFNEKDVIETILKMQDLIVKSASMLY